MNALGMLGLVLMVSLAFSSFASAGEAVIIRTVPQGVCVMGSECRVDVYADNTALAGEPTKAAQWRLVSALPGRVALTRAEIPSGSTNFFNGFSMALNSVTPTWNLQGRQVFGLGPSNAQGYLGTYYFTVASGKEIMNAQFGLTSVGFCRGGVSGCTAQPYVIENLPFRVASVNDARAMEPKVCGVAEDC